MKNLLKFGKEEFLFIIVPFLIYVIFSVFFIKIWILSVVLTIIIPFVLIMIFKPQRNTVYKEESV